MIKLLLFLWGLSFYIANNWVAALPSFRLRHWYYRHIMRYTIGRDSSVHMGVFVTGRHIHLGDNVVINRHVYLDGRVGIRLVDPGNIVRSSDTGGIVTINQVQPISVVFTLPQQELGKVRDALQQNKALQVFALDRDNLSRLSHGTLAVLDNQIDSTTATVKLKATFDNAFNESEMRSAELGSRFAA